MSTQKPVAPLYNYQAKILRWLDGDSCEVSVDLGFKISILEVVRVWGINSPEIHSLNAAEKKAGLEAKAFAESLAPVGNTVLIKTFKAAQEDEKFGRWLAVITLVDGNDFATEMMATNHAAPYFGGHRDKPPPDRPGGTP